MPMFRIEFFVDDKNLAHVLRGIAGAGKNLSVQPVVESQVKQAKTGVVSAKGNSLTERMVSEMKKRNLTEFTAVHAKEVAKVIGLSRNSYQHMLKVAFRTGVIKKHGKAGGMTYTLVA